MQGALGLPTARGLGFGPLGLPGDLVCAGGFSSERGRPV